jgi:hypothetical protein
MGWSEMLGTLKGKVLDAANLELLEHTYNLQERTIKQLESNNNALEKNNELLEKENKGLTTVIKDCEEQLGGFEKKEDPKKKYSENALAILSYFVENDKTKEHELILIGSLKGKDFSEIQIKAGIAELSKDFKIILPFSTADRGLGVEWGFTNEGKMLLAELSE